MDCKTPQGELPSRVREFDGSWRGRADGILDQARQLRRLDLNLEARTLGACGPRQRRLAQGLLITDQLLDEHARGASASMATPQLLQALQALQADGRAAVSDACARIELADGRSLTSVFFSKFRHDDRPVPPTARQRMQDGYLLGCALGGPTLSADNLQDVVSQWFAASRVGGASSWTLPNAQWFLQGFLRASGVGAQLAPPWLRGLLEQLMSPALRELPLGASAVHLQGGVAVLVDALEGPHMLRATLKSLLRAIADVVPMPEPAAETSHASAAGTAPAPHAQVAGIPVDAVLVALHSGVIRGLRQPDGQLSERWVPRFEKHLNELARARPGTAALEIATELRIALNDRQPSAMASLWNTQWELWARMPPDPMATRQLAVDLATKTSRRAGDMTPHAWTSLCLDLGKAAAGLDPEAHLPFLPNFASFLQIAMAAATSRSARGLPTDDWLAGSGRALADQLQPDDAALKAFESSLANLERCLGTEQRAKLALLATGFRPAAVPRPVGTTPLRSPERAEAADRRPAAHAADRQVPAEHRAARAPRSPVRED
ncbi:hypothetical protein JI739_05055 [Ramlibacter sp. AW1]|uniref:Uncharacterized protein n=1 Tax=Ramlibacter aurantiacus TaxID=2801330 RepID=A0A936ZG97_9BURK|nr:hypothetical protein [Ramlibacter aurantiacus]MBL0419713.1 hypothetical protein [Ramlibacter aurantiacus]